MRRTLAAVLMTALCLLTACGSKETDELQAAMDFRAALLQAEGCTFTAAVTADYGDRSYEFTLDCVCRTDDTLFSEEKQMVLLQKSRAAAAALDMILFLCRTDTIKHFRSFRRMRKI